MLSHILADRDVVGSVDTADPELTADESSRPRRPIISQKHSPRVRAVLDFLVDDVSDDVLTT